MWDRLSEHAPAPGSETDRSERYSNKTILIIFAAVVGAIYTAVVVSVYVLA